MSYILKQNNVQLAISGGWNPNLFGKLTGTSYPAQVTQDYIWEHEGYWLGWEDDPLPIPLSDAEIALQKDAENEQLRLEAYRNESDPLFFKYQRDEIQKQIWLDKVAEIKARYT
jgi:hypothetical protein